MIAAQASSLAVVRSRIHPEFCDTQLCEEHGPDLLHREVPEVFVPVADSGNVITYGLVQGDELDGETQTMYRADAALSIGGQTAHLNLDELDALAEELHALARRGRRGAARPALG